MTSTTSFGDTGLEFLNLSLCSEESAQLHQVRATSQIVSRHTRFLANLRALLSLLFLNNSMIRFS